MEVLQGSNCVWGRGGGSSGTVSLSCCSVITVIIPFVSNATSALKISTSYPHPFHSLPLCPFLPWSDTNLVFTWDRLSVHLQVAQLPFNFYTRLFPIMIHTRQEPVYIKNKIWRWKLAWISGKGVWRERRKLDWRQGWCKWVRDVWIRGATLLLV